VLLDAELLHQLAEARTPIGTLLSYKPDSPRKDLIFHPACMDLPSSLRFATGRLVADTDRSVERIRALLVAHKEPDAATIGEWLIQRDESHVERLPREVEIELTTDTPYANSILRPAVPASEARGPLDTDILRRLAEDLGAADDSLVFLGGFGDPLRHPRLAEILATLTCAGHRPFGIALRTGGLDLAETAIELLIQNRVDLCVVALDAWTASLYSSLHSPDDPALADLEIVLGRLNRLPEMRQSRGSTVPIVVPEFCKAKENVQEMDAFFDGWIRRTGTVSIIGYSHRAGQLADRSVIDMRPPVRTPCRRIRSRCVVLANGDVTICEQDYRGQHVIGSLRTHSLEELWQSAEFERLRARHVAGGWDTVPLCAACSEWHRP
jgi:radical SAM protein with 4Fe4S-binding SPASM domain